MSIKYPNNIKKKVVSKTSHSNRGMDLENMINMTNEYYLNNNIALIYKKPTPINAVKVSYENTKKIINKAFFKAPSTLDYNGLYKGKYIEFEAKETKNKTSFPLSNIHAHQIKHIRSVLEHNGICFIIISMNSLIYLLKGSDFIEYIDNNTRKSIDYNFLRENGFIIKVSYQPTIDYLSIVDNIYF